MSTRLAYPLDEAAAQIGVSLPTLRREIRAGEIQAKRVRGRRVVLHSELERYLTSRAVLLPAIETTPLVAHFRKPSGRSKVVRLIDISADQQRAAEPAGRGERGS